MEVSGEEVYQSLLLGSTPREGRGWKQEWAEGEGSTVTMEALANSMGAWGMQRWNWPALVCPQLWAALGGV